MYISHLSLRNWKNFQHVAAELELRTFIIGPNASGKSNLLDALRFLHDVANDGLRKAVDDTRGGLSALRCLSARRYSNIDLGVTIQDGGEHTWQYLLSLNQDNQKRPVVREERVTKDGVPVLQRPDARDAQDSLLLTQTSLEQISANQEFREVAQFLRSISYQHLLPQVVRDPRGFSPLPVQDDPYGRDFIMRMWSTPARTRDARLRKISAALASAVPQLSELRVEMDESGTPHLIGGYAHWRPHEAKQNESQFSDGTLRLLGLLWTMFEGDGPLLLEEPEISLHPEVVRRLPAIFHRMGRSRKRPRQVLVSTHSVEMLSDPGIGPEEVLILIPSPDGTVVKHPDPADREAMAAGLTAADVLVPQTAPEKIHQLTFDLG